MLEDESADTCSLEEDEKNLHKNMEFFVDITMAGKYNNLCQ
ncbi:hypothetical protein T472_0210650 [Youngiibacter fragilis 232.1]|uniref:Uncharacterized protein n=1 Tax=Youngiibacter fragilis 232.1 TaxID=994573 RepID=V7I5T8_9CLOT|nr:hypothetical protein T472_0210650 [Youngiibacter fragilis 232.1]